MPPLKPIAVKPTKRAGGRKQPSPAVDAVSDDMPFAVAIAREPRRVMAAPAHCYRVGERLLMQGGGYSTQRQAATCKVMGLLPYEGRGALLYRIRSDAEAFERIVPESDLSRS